MDWSNFDTVAERLSLGFGELASRVPLIVANPRAYPRESMLLVLILALGVLLTVVLGIVIFDAIKSLRERPNLAVKGKGRPRLRRLATVVVSIFVVTLILSLLPRSVAVSQQCDVCHQLEPAVAAWEVGSHPAVSCYGCHARPGISGAMEASLSGASQWVARSASGTSTAMSEVPVYEESCLSCHGAITDEIVGGAVRMRHSDVIEVGYACTSCHRGVGHEELASIQPAVAESLMATCLVCHDGEAAPAECEVCHVGQPSDRVAGDSSATTALNITCKGCHQLETDQRCLACHGLELPHPVEFMGQHAGLSSDDPGLCADCHESANPPAACACHPDENVHGTYSAWFPQHGPAARTNGPGGCNCHNSSFCAFCHEQSPF